MLVFNLFVNNFFCTCNTCVSVSYTHLDVYKRQGMDLMVSCWFARTIWWILTMFTSIRLVTGHLFFISHFLPPLRKPLIHLYTAVFFMAFSLYTCTNISCISLPFLLSFTRNQMFVHCCNSSSDIFMTAHTQANCYELMLRNVWICRNMLRIINFVRTL